MLLSKWHCTSKAYPRISNCKVSKLSRSEFTVETFGNQNNWKLRLLKGLVHSETCYIIARHPSSLMIRFQNVLTPTKLFIFFYSQYMQNLDFVNFSSKALSQIPPNITNIWEPVEINLKKQKTISWCKKFKLPDSGDNTTKSSYCIGYCNHHYHCSETRWFWNHPIWNWTLTNMFS